MSNPTRTSIERAIADVLTQTGRSAPPLRDDLVLSRDLKLDSLDLAQVVVQLETELGFDPFRKASISIDTVGDLINLYTAHHKD